MLNAKRLEEIKKSFEAITVENATHNIPESIINDFADLLEEVERLKKKIGPKKRRSKKKVETAEIEPESDQDIEDSAKDNTDDR